ncbi:hypothetical protein DRH13_00240 [Candidatus Woesebacteria bacterium]|nr:MAG: hypothetical protein DRH13_00240 [Candidatus Woesebacteria bacterium]
METQQMSKDTNHQISKSQTVRLADIFIYGPFMIWAATRKEIPTWGKWLLGSLGIGTIYYNARNYYSTKQVSVTGNVDSLAQVFLQNWIDLLCKRDPRIVELYSPNAVLLPTFEKVKKGRGEIAGYFENLMQKEGLCANIDSITTKSLGNGLATSGIYTFKFLENGEPQTQRARFTYVFKPHDGNWLIESHHSSVIP